MSIIVKGMKMPDSCYHCKIAESCGHYIANYINRRHPDCPLIALPDKHGRLIDERVAELCIGDHMTGFAGREGRSDWQRVHDGLADAPTIVEAEDGS